MQKTYTNRSTRVRLIVILVVFAAIGLYAVRLGGGQSPEDLRALVEAKGPQLLSLRDWMAEKDVRTIMVLSKNNRREGEGEFVQVGRYYRYYYFFDGPAGLMQDPSNFTEMTIWMLALSRSASSYGIYRYAWHADSFEIVVSGDPYGRLPGMAGTPVYYTDAADALPDAGSLTDIGGGWYAAAAHPGTFLTDTRSPWFYAAAALAAWTAIQGVVALCYRKHQCRAGVSNKRTEVVLPLSRRVRQSLGGPPGSSEAYQLAFVTENGNMVTVYVPSAVYVALSKGDAGRLVYRQLGRRQKFVSFTVEEGVPPFDTRV